MTVTGSREALDADEQSYADLRASGGLFPEAYAGTAYGIIDPDYARIFTIARCLAWAEGYALAMHGSFTRDLDLVAVPWASHACEPEHLAKRIENAAGLRISVPPKNDKPFGRLVWTMMLPAFGDPRFVDLSILPVCPPGDLILPGSDDMERRESWLRDKAADMGYALSPDPAGVTLTVEEIAATIRAKFVENWKCSELGSAWDEDVLLTGCRKVGNGKGYQNPEEAAQNLATDAAAAILSLIQKSVQPSIATKPATSGTAAPVCELPVKGHGWEGEFTEAEFLERAEDHEKAARNGMAAGTNVSYVRTFQACALALRIAAPLLRKERS